MEPSDFFRVAGRLLRHGDSLRNAADYDLSDATPEDRPTADLWLKKAKGHAEALAAAFGGPNGPALATGIGGYQARIRGTRTGR
jgi:hypothetical protein